ncbi:hypothetical protein FOA43_001899 [Brettanomyces nanus]|uniref:Protein kinase domain-containing protein n=1 Tax=Eeniella nana TaxID=13502 RepID=A0A875S0S5_EENNA|nr:uncharacterized protein FOA43_001899 [Brettanomyces nanus]QPG74568.1 hypothetical protein FOA43_001899 [Brettanomyces nanus]
MTFKFGFKEVRTLGGGQFSTVYEVLDEHHPTNSRRYALKVVEPDDERPPHNVRNECAIMTKLKQHKGVNSYSENVLRLIAEFTNPLEIGLLFPLYACTLSDVINHYCKRHTKFNVDGTLSKVTRNEMESHDIHHVIHHLLSGLNFIHSCGIIHRDINPNNIMFQGLDSLEPVIIDFGISYELPTNNGLESPNLKFTDIATGYFKAPELLLSVRNYSYEVDIWSMAIIIALLCSNDGSVPFDEDSAHSDLALLSNIVTVFGSPPKDWQDCKGSRTFHAMNDSFFAKKPKPMSEILPRVVDFDQNIVDVFQGMTKYPSKERLTAKEALMKLK